MGLWFAFVADVNSQGTFPVSQGQTAAAAVNTTFNWTSAPDPSRHCVGQSTNSSATCIRTGG